MSVSEEDYEEELRADRCSSLLSADVFFTGTADGKIVKLIGRRIHAVTRLGKPPCGENLKDSTSV